MIARIPSALSKHVLIMLACAVAVCPAQAEAQQEAEGRSAPAALTELSLEELMNIEVTSVSKKQEPQREAAAAIFVITQEDIRRSGVTSIPEALRMVPGLSVAHLDANKWSVTSRGFSGIFANKLLVLIDGRTIYTPLFSGVFWESQDVILEDIDRIEVIRGPGGALWGANAVNGVINIVTKTAAATQGGLATMGLGTEERGFGAVRYGGPLGKTGHYRLHAKYIARDESVLESGERAADAWDRGHGGFRMDWGGPEEDRFTLAGDAYAVDISETLVLPVQRPPYRLIHDSSGSFGGGHLLARWDRQLADGSDLQLQCYYDRTQLGTLQLDDIRDTFDIEFQHRLQAGKRHEIVWGAGFRYVQDFTEGSQFISLSPSDRRYRLFSAFIQDQIALVEEELHLALGTKLEHNDFTGNEVQPSVRLAWTPNESHAFWGAVSRAVRTPSRTEDDVRIASLAFPRSVVALYGNRDFDSEELLAFELGYRTTPTHWLGIDVALFYNIYDDLRTLELRRPFLEVMPWPVHIAIPAVGFNNAEAESYGVELALDCRPTSWWRLRLAYALIEMDLDLHPKTIDPETAAINGDTPEQQVYLQSRFDLTRDLDFDVMLRYVDPLPSLGVDDYTTADVRLAWRPRDNLEVAVVGQNLLDAHHGEFSPSFLNTLPAEAQRGVYGELTWRF